MPRLANLLAKLLAKLLEKASVSGERGKGGVGREVTFSACIYIKETEHAI